MDRDSHLRRMNRLLTGLSRVNHAIFRIREDRGKLLQEISGIIHEQSCYDLVWLGEINREGEVLFGASQGTPLPGVAPALSSEQSSTTGGNGAAVALARLGSIAVQAASDKRAILSKPLEAVNTAGADVALRASAVPVPIDPDSTFVLMVSACQSEAFSAEETNVILEMATNIGVAIETMEVQSRTSNAERALRIAEERFRRLSESSLVGIVLIQNDLYRYVNPAFATMFAYGAPDEIIDKLGPLDLAAPGCRDLVQENVEKRVLGQVRSISYQYDGLRKDGSVFRVEEHGARTVHANRLAVVATVIDVTAREASRRKLEALSEVGVSLSQAQTPQQVLDRAVQKVTAVLPCDTAVLITFATDGATPDAVVSYPDGDSGIAALLSGEDRATADEVLTRLMGAGESAIVFDGTASPDQHGPETHAFVAAPLIVRGDRTGLIAVEATQPGRFSDEDAQHLRLFADHVAATLQHLRLIESLETERNRLRTVNGLAQTLAETLRISEVAARALRHIGGTLEARISLLLLWDAQTKTLAAVASEGASEATLEALNVELHADGLAADAAAPWGAVAEVAEPANPRGSLDQSRSPGTTTDERHGAAGRRQSYSEPTGFVELVAGAEGIDNTERPTRSPLSHALDIPLETHGEFLGRLVFLAGAEGFGEADVELAKALSVPVALALQNARFYERAAQHAEVMTEALQHQEELDQMKDELIQNISHELRTPLSLVMGYAEMLVDGELGEMLPGQAAAMEVIARRSRMLRSLVEDIALLWHLERQTAQKEWIDLHEIVEVTVDEFRGRAQAGDLTLEVRTPPDAVLVEAVALQIRRVLDNLIGNSLKFTSPGGRISVALEVVDENAELSVEDNGIGVPNEKLKRIFERFYQVDGGPRRKYGGTGLGLALVKAIVDAHGGDIRAVSPATDEPDRPGTRITISLPISDPPDDYEPETD